MAAGIGPGEFWGLSLRELVWVLEGAKRSVELVVMQAWHVEAFRRTKRLGPLREYLSRLSGPPSPAEVERKLDALFAGMGVADG